MAPRKPVSAENADQTDATASAEITTPTAPDDAENGATVESGADSAVVTPTPSDLTSLKSSIEQALGGDADEEDDQPEFIEVVVRPKKHVQHNGKQHPANSAVELPRADAERLKARGVVDYLEDLQNAAQASPRVSVTGGMVTVS